jgi:hypothetical protein
MLGGAGRPDQNEEEKEYAGYWNGWSKIHWTVTGHGQCWLDDYDSNKTNV